MLYRKHPYIRNIFFETTTQDEKLSVAASRHGGGAYGYFPMKSEALGYDAEVSTKPDLREAFSMGPMIVSDRLKNVMMQEEEKEEGTCTFDTMELTTTIQSSSTSTTTLNKAMKDTFFQNVVKFCYQETPWPTNNVQNPSFQLSMCKFYQEASKVGRILLRIIPLALKQDLDLDLEEDYFLPAVMDGEHSNSARAIWYPKLTTPPLNGQARCGAHSDTGILPILWSDQLGLQIQQPRKSPLDAHGNSQDSRWVTVKTPPNTLLVNIGDMLQKISNNKWHSTPHRVLAPNAITTTTSGTTTATTTCSSTTNNNNSNNTTIDIDILSNNPSINENRLVLVLFVILAADFYYRS